MVENGEVSGNLEELVKMSREELERERKQDEKREIFDEYMDYVDEELAEDLEELERGKVQEGQEARELGEYGEGTATTVFAAREATDGKVKAFVEEQNRKAASSWMKNDGVQGATAADRAAYAKLQKSLNENFDREGGRPDGDIDYRTWVNHTRQAEATRRIRLGSGAGATAEYKQITGKVYSPRELRDPYPHLENRFLYDRKYIPVVETEEQANRGVGVSSGPQSEPHFSLESPFKPPAEEDAADVAARRAEVGRMRAYRGMGNAARTGLSVYNNALGFEDDSARIGRKPWEDLIGGVDDMELPDIGMESHAEEDESAEEF